MNDWGLGEYDSTDRCSLPCMLECNALIEYSGTAGEPYPRTRSQVLSWLHGVRW